MSESSEHRRPHPFDLAWLRLGPHWSWLAVVPGAPGLEVAPVARALASVGGDVTAGAVEFIDGTMLDLPAVPDFVTALRKEKREARSIVALASPLESAAALEVARSADGVVLCALRGETRVSSVRATVDAVGEQRITCSLLLERRGPAA